MLPSPHRKGGERTMAMNGVIQDQQAMVEHEMLTVQEVAQFLRVPISTIYKLARRGHLPASKIGKHWRFTRRGLDEWVRGSYRIY